MSSGCTTAGSTLAQWVAAARWSLFTQFFRLSGIRPGGRQGEREGRRLRQAAATKGTPEAGAPPGTRAVSTDSLPSGTAGSCLGSVAFKARGPPTPSNRSQLSSAPNPTCLARGFQSEADRARPGRLTRVSGFLQGGGNTLRAGTPSRTASERHTHDARARAALGSSVLGVCHARPRAARLPSHPPPTPQKTPRPRGPRPAHL